MSDEIRHLSYSQLSTYLDCPRKWYLGKKVKAEETPTWFLPLGTTVHQMIEDHLDPAAAFRSAEEIFFPLVEKQMLLEPDTSKWLSGSLKGAPLEGALALQTVKDCFEKALEFLDEIDVWDVEKDASGPLPGLDVPVVAYVDILGEHKKYGPVIADWKTSAQKPKDSFQLDTYNALLQTAGLLIDFKGLWMMVRPDASKAKPITLTASPEVVGAKYQEVLDQMRKKIYATKHAKFRCDYCTQGLNCLVNAGPTDRAKYFDKSAHHGLPF